MLPSSRLVPITLVLFLSAASAFAGHDLRITSLTVPSSLNGGEQTTMIVSAVNNGADPAPDGYVGLLLKTTANGVALTPNYEVARPIDWEVDNPAAHCTMGTTWISCWVRPFAAGASVTLKATVALPPQLGDVKPAIVTSNASTGIFVFDNDGNGTGVDSDVRSETTNVTQLTDVAPAGTAPASVTSGDTLSFTVEADNKGPSWAHDAQITWATPPGAAFVGLGQYVPYFNPVPVPWQCTTPPVGGSGTVTCTHNPLYPTNYSYSDRRPVYLVFTMRAPASPGVITNKATMSTSTPQSTTANDTTTVTTTIVAPNADLAVTNQWHSNVAYWGDKVGHIIKIVNNGPTLSSSAVLTLSSTPGATLDGFGDLRCTLPIPATCSVQPLAPGQATEFNMTLQMPSTAGVVTVNAALPARAEDPVHANDSSSASITVDVPPQAILVVTPVAPPSITEGGTAEVTFKVTNSGPRDATHFVSTARTCGRVLSVTTPTTGVTCTHVYEARCSMDTLPVGASMTYTLNFEVPWLATTCEADVDSSSDYTVNNGFSLKIPVASAPRITDLELALSTSPANVMPGDLLTLYFTVRNAGQTPTAGTEILEVPLPEGARPWDTSGYWDASLPGWRIPIRVLMPGSSDAAWCYLVAPTAPSVKVTGRIIAPADPVQSNNTATKTIPIGGNWADLAATITGQLQVPPSVATTYHVTVLNQGPANSQSRNMTISLDGATFGNNFEQTSGPVSGCTRSFALISCSIPLMQLGTLIDFRFDVTPSVPSGSQFRLAAELTTDANDPFHDNDSAAVAPRIAATSPVLTSSLTAPPSAPALGTVTIGVTLRDSGDPAIHPSVTFTPPSGSTIDSIRQSDGPSFECTSSGGVGTCQGASLDASRSASFVVTVHVGAASGVFHSTVTVSSDTTTPFTIPLDLPIVANRRRASR